MKTNTVLYAVQTRKSDGHAFYTVNRYSNLQDAVLEASHLDYANRRILEQTQGKKPRKVDANILDALTLLA